MDTNKVDQRSEAGNPQVIPHDALEFTDQAEGSYVYFLMKDGVCVYVGQTTNLRRRLKQHGDKDYDRVVFIHVHDDVRLETESAFIEELSPKYNGEPGRPRTGQMRRRAVRMSNSDWALVCEAAESLGQTPSKFIRESLIEETDRILAGKS